MELKDTIPMMVSDDYKERFKAEYNQLQIRYVKLKVFVEKYENGELSFTPNCSIEVLKRQLIGMRAYGDCLLERAYIEDVDLL